jgi:hypothetical protein
MFFILAQNSLFFVEVLYVWLPTNLVVLVTFLVTFETQSIYNLNKCAFSKNVCKTETSP